MNININPGKTAIFLGVAMVALIGLHVLGYLSFVFTSRPHPIEWFNLDSEANLPTLFSTFLLMFSGLLLALIACAEYQGDGKSLPWWILALTFIALGMDESILIHERVSKIIQSRFNTSGIFHFAWVLPYGLAFLTFVAIMLRFFLRLPNDTRKWLFIGAVIYVGGALGMEMFGSALIVEHGRNLLYYVYATIEEGMEMSAGIIFVYAFANHIDKHLSGLTLSINSSQD
jgi:hypothetical protein